MQIRWQLLKLRVIFRCFGVGREEIVLSAYLEEEKRNIAGTSELVKIT